MQRVVNCPHKFSKHYVVVKLERFDNYLRKFLNGLVDREDSVAWVVVVHRAYALSYQEWDAGVRVQLTHRVSELCSVNVGAQHNPDLILLRVQDLQKTTGEVLMPKNLSVFVKIIEAGEDMHRKYKLSV